MPPKESLPQQPLPDVEFEQGPPEPDFLEEMGHMQGSIAGQNKTFTELAAMCPLPVEKMSREQRNNFITKAVIGSGTEVPPHLASSIAKRAETLGLEPSNIKSMSEENWQKSLMKRDITPAAETPKTDKQTEQKTETSSANIEKKQVMPIAEQQDANVETIEKPPVAIEQPIHLKTAHTQIVHEIVAAAVTVEQIVRRSEPKQEIVTPELDEAPKVEIPLPAQDAVERHIQDIHIQQQATEQIESVDVVPSEEADISDDYIEHARESEVDTSDVAVAPNSAEMPLDETTGDLQSETTDALPQSVDETVAMPEYVPATDHEQIDSTAEEIVFWEEVLEQEPAELPAVFAATLLQYAEISARVPEPIESTENYLSNPTETGEEIVAVPPIVNEVAVRLIELPIEKQSEAVQTLQSIAGAVHGLKLLEARSAPEEQLAAVEVQLVELCQELFETLGIDYARRISATS